MKTKYANLTILTLFFLFLATENLKNHFIFDFLVFNFSIWRDFASQKQRLELTTLFVTFVSCFFL